MKILPRNHQKPHYKEFLVSFLSNIFDNKDGDLENCMTVGRILTREMESEVVHKKIHIQLSRKH